MKHLRTALFTLFGCLATPFVAWRERRRIRNAHEAWRDEMEQGGAW